MHNQIFFSEENSDSMYNHWWHGLQNIQWAKAIRRWIRVSNWDNIIRKKHNAVVVLMDRKLNLGKFP